jgi:hypothetical protein
MVFDLLLSHHIFLLHSKSKEMEKQNILSMWAGLELCLNFDDQPAICTLKHHRRADRRNLITTSTFGILNHASKNDEETKKQGYMPQQTPDTPTSRLTKRDYARTKSRIASSNSSDFFSFLAIPFFRSSEELPC